MFLSNKEKRINKQYLNQGYVIQNIDDAKSLKWIREYFCELIKKKFPKLKKEKPENILNNIHKYLSPSNLNIFRLDIFNKINSKKDFREHFYKISKSLVDTIVGNEVSMQLTHPSSSLQFCSNSSSHSEKHSLVI